MPQIRDGQPSFYIAHCASRGPPTVLSNTHHHNPLAKLRSSTTQQPQANRRFNHPGSSTFFQRQSPHLVTTLIRRLTPLPPVHFLGFTPAFLPERSSLAAASLKALGATNNNTSNEEQPFALAASSVAGVEPEDKEALGDSPAEEPTVDRLPLKESKRRTQVLLGVLAAIPIIGLVVVFAVVVRKKDNVDASAGGLGGSPTGTGTAETTSNWKRKDTQ